ncbi:MAG: transporter [Halovenus sp.]
MSRRRRQASRGLKETFPIGRGAALGSVAYVLGYVVTYLFVRLSSDSADLGIVAALTDISQFDITGWMFYNAHFVDVTATTSAAGQSQSESTNMLSEASNLAVPELFWYLVPIFFLILAGFIVAMTISQSSHTRKAVGAGATVLVGYLPLSIAGLFLFGASVETFGGGATATIGPDKAMGILFAGIVFPVVFGMLGGLLASLVSTGGGTAIRSRVSRHG